MSIGAILMLTGGALLIVGAWKSGIFARMRADWNYGWQAGLEHSKKKRSPYYHPERKPKGNSRAKEIGIFIGVCLLLVGIVVSFALWRGF